MNEQVRDLDRDVVASATSADWKSADGVALLITVLILFVVSLLGATMVNLGRVDLALSANYRASTSSVHLADSGLQATAADLRADFLSNPTGSALVGWVNLNASPPQVANPFPNAAGTMVNGHTLSPTAISANPFPGVAYSLGSPASLGSGSYSRIIWLPPTVTMTGGAPTLNFRVRSIGIENHRETPARTVVDAVVRVDVSDLSGYANAMLLGPGKNGDVIKGGILRVAGPMVVVGNPGRRGRGGRPNSELRLGNMSQIINSYRDIARNDGLGPVASKIPALYPQQYNGDAVATLNTALHLKDVVLDIRPAAALGSPDVTGNRYQETLDGIYTDGYVDQAHRNLHVDEVAPFDLGNIDFPSLSEPYTDPAGGSQYSEYSDWLEANAYAPMARNDLEITKTTASFSHVDPSGNGSLSWDASTETLTVSGLIKIDGKIVLGERASSGRGGRGGPPLSAVKYAGTGVLWSTRDIEIKQDLFPAGRYLQDGPDADNQVDGNLGLISSRKIRLDAGSPSANLRVVAALFAEDELDVRSSANVAGSVITRHVGLRSFRRLSVWYVPTLASAAPAGMPGTVGAPTISVGVGEWFQQR